MMVPSMYGSFSGLFVCDEKRFDLVRDSSPMCRIRRLCRQKTDGSEWREKWILFAPFWICDTVEAMFN